MKETIEHHLTGKTIKSKQATHISGIEMVLCRPSPIPLVQSIFFPKRPFTLPEGSESQFVFPAAACEEVEVALRKFMDECKVLPAALSTYPDIRVTFSIGLVDAKDQESVTHTLARADNLMYQAKANGKDQVVITN